MRVDAFDFDLPPDRIALRPASPREAARLLLVPAAGGFGERTIGDLPSVLRSGDVLVANDTRVLPARLRAVRRRSSGPGARIELLLHRRLTPDTWLAFARPAKRLTVGDRIAFADNCLQAEIENVGARGEVSLRFAISGPQLDAAVQEIGEVPLPPYIANLRTADAQDEADYQTIFARETGAVAAPTAGLHVTAGLLEKLSERGIAVETVTLHVGAGTFLPVTADDTADHRMHSEQARLDGDTAERINRARAAGGRVVALGTTALRTLESAGTDSGELQPFSGETDIFITPGYRFRSVDLLLTNFHLPRSTLFMLVAALAGFERIQSAYVHAIRSGFRFYSYGDACLIERA